MSGMPGPPPPPPFPGQRGGPPAQFVNLRGGSGPAPPLPPPGVRPPGPPPGQFQLPVRQVQSTRVSDITPRRPLDEDACRKKLTNYEAYTIRKIVPRESKEKPTWAKAEIIREPLSQEDIVKAVKKLNENRRSVQDKKASLMTFQQGQVNRLLDDIMSADHDINFEWSMAQLDSKTFTNKKGQKETSTMTVYVKRAPLKDLNAAGIYEAIERNKRQRLEQLNRPPPQRPEPHGAEPDHHPIINMGKIMDMNDKFNGGGKLKRPKKQYHDHHSSDSYSSDSDSDSASSYSSSENTTISTNSGRRSRKYNQKGRSQSRRPREHRKKYYVQDRVRSPEPLHRESMVYPRYVPEVPRVIPNVAPGFDPVTAAYQAGKIDADAERFGFDRYPRRAPVEPTAIVSYGRPERIYAEPRYEEVRYVDDREEDYRREEQFRREERRRRQEVEDYLDRRGSDSRLEPRIIYTQPNPFAPASLSRRY